MCVYMWKFNNLPDPKVVERFIDDQVPLFARYSKALTGADGEPVVDLMKVEHNCGAVNLEFQLNGVEGQSGDVFCFPGYYPGAWTTMASRSSTSVIPTGISTHRSLPQCWSAPRKYLI